jgi:hypothetical protein
MRSRRLDDSLRRLVPARSANITRAGLPIFW